MPDHQYHQLINRIGFKAVKRKMFWESIFSWTSLYAVIAIAFIGVLAWGIGQV